MANPLSQFYDGLSTEADLQRLIDSKERESLHLEFKRKRHPDVPSLSDADASQFSRALSGFANSDGGVMLWGIGVNKDEEADLLDPITDHQAFLRALKSSLLNSTQPFVDGVLADPIDSATVGAGYVKVLIPASDKAPHRAMLAKREYYKRSTEGFYRLEHFDLEDMFGRRPVPRLQLRVRLITGGSIGGGGQTQHLGFAVFSIENVGRGSARAPYLSVLPSEPYSVAGDQLYGRSDGLQRRGTSDDRRLTFTSADVVIHPEVIYEVAAVRLSASEEHRMNLVIPRDLTLNYMLAAENAALTRGEITIRGVEIAKAIVPKNVLEFNRIE